MGPGDGATSVDCDHAFALGRAIAQAGWVLLTGGRDAGVMAAANQGAQSAGGLTVGILPSADHSHLAEGVDIAIVTGMGHARNAINVLSCDVVIACGIGLGTASEVALAMKSGKPVILLGWNDVIQQWIMQFNDDSLQQNPVKIAETPEMAIALVSQLV
jgi:uncharacterized protein (TIGR00725 family)